MCWQVPPQSAQSPIPMLQTLMTVRWNDCLHGLFSCSVLNLRAIVFYLPCYQWIMGSVWAECCSPAYWYEWSVQCMTLNGSIKNTYIIRCWLKPKHAESLNTFRPQHNEHQMWKVPYLTLTRATPPLNRLGRGFLNTPPPLTRRLGHVLIRGKQHSKERQK